jgi:hypothetical protein
MRAETEGSVLAAVVNAMRSVRIHAPRTALGPKYGPSLRVEMQMELLKSRAWAIIYPYRLQWNQQSSYRTVNRRNGYKGSWWRQ